MLEPDILATDDDDSDFARLVPGVKPLRRDKINVYGQRPRQPLLTRPRPVLAPDTESAAVSSGTPAQAERFDSGLQKKLQRRIRRGEIRPQASLDLHGMRQDEALDALERFLEAVVADGLRMVVIVHGQGLRSGSEAVLKPLVQRWLASRAQVLAFCPAQPRDGASGATYAYLRIG